MKVALIGASGNVGSQILAELIRRGHAVTGIVRHPKDLPTAPGVTAEAGDVSDEDGLARLITKHDAVISAVRFTASDPHKLITAVRRSGVKRYIVVGGAGSLELATGVRVMDAPNFPPEYRAEAAAGGVFLDALRADTKLDWSFLSPSAAFTPGERTGKFRLDHDLLLTNEQGSSISFEDYAVALVDELEHPGHLRQRFTVGY